MRLISWLISLFALSIHAAYADQATASIDPADYKASVKVACVGDSITQGKQLNYPSFLQEMLGDQWQVQNFGHSGRTLMKKPKATYWKSPKYKAALEFQPDVVMIKLGTNDANPTNWQAKDQFIPDYKALIQSFQSLPSKPRIYICRTIPVFQKPKVKITQETIAEQLSLIDAMAKDLGLPVIDMHAVLEGKAEWVPDGVHPNPTGYRAMAAAAYTALTGKPAPAVDAK